MIANPQSVEEVVGSTPDVATTAVLMLSVFTVSVGFGVVLPHLPSLIERLLGGRGGTGQISLHTGLLTAMYTLPLFVFAPLWGRLSDRHGPRKVLLVGLMGFAVTMLAFSLAGSLLAVYAERFFSGMFAAAVTPVAAAVAARSAPTEHQRARRLAFVSMAGIVGFMLGPMLSVSVTQLAAHYFDLIVPAGSTVIPLAATAALALLIALAVAVILPSNRIGAGLTKDGISTAPTVFSNRPIRLLAGLLALSFIVSAGIGVFEVGLALRGKLELALPPYRIGLMFTECSVVMFAVQAFVFSPWFNPTKTHWLIAPALLVLASGLFLVPYASNFVSMLIVIGAVAASAGVLSPIITYWISAKAGTAQGLELGKQTATSSLGVTVGSMVGGLLFDIAALPGASFTLASLVVVFGFAISLKLRPLLASAKLTAGGIVNNVPQRR